MTADGIPSKIVNLIKAYYASTRARVVTGSEVSKEFALISGVRQGCVFFPVLFNIAIDYVMCQSMEGHESVDVNQSFAIRDLEYADDVILGKTVGDVQRVLDRVGRFAEQVGVRVNVNKTKYFTNGIESDDPPTIYGTPITKVDCFNNFGSFILPDGRAIDEIEARINKARGVFMQLSKAVWKRSEITLRTKTCIYRAAIRSVLLYGCETWPLTASDMRKLETFDHWCLRILAKV